ncbi:MAG TPA: EthD domain-containing protein, partial [Myxococcota bacterium]|nr:EthD domain-containing protein [Myxococcota bacterium]
VFEQPARLGREEFIARWHGSHTPLSLEVHPLWRYVRNAVARPLSAGAPPYAGIVEEHVRELADLTDPARFYGGAERMAANMRRILEDARSFLDLERVASVVTSEYILSS